ncbi:MAG: hypothetical protein NTX50_18075 [Candidatus Sumerlaeota bacterium]|nr:hypothetical protein [Candidatus Sumerlaeota bacterium]
MENSEKSFKVSDAFLLGAIDEQKDHHVCVYVPSKTRDEKPLPHKVWVDATIQVMSELFGGATAVEGMGGWLDVERGNKVKKEEVTMVFSFITAEEWNERNVLILKRFVCRMGREAKQGEIGMLMDGRFFRIRRFDYE